MRCATFRGLPHCHSPAPPAHQAISTSAANPPTVNLSSYNHTNKERSTSRQQRSLPTPAPPKCWAPPQQGSPMPLEVIGAGWGRTGTFSLKAALDHLGYPCYHMTEVLPCGHSGTWLQAVQSESSAGCCRAHMPAVLLCWLCCCTVCGTQQVQMHLQSCTAACAAHIGCAACHDGAGPLPLACAAPPPNTSYTLPAAAPCHCLLLHPATACCCTLPLPAAGIPAPTHLDLRRSCTTHQPCRHPLLPACSWQGARLGGAV